MQEAHTQFACAKVVVIVDGVSTCCLFGVFGVIFNSVVDC